MAEPKWSLSEDGRTMSVEFPTTPPTAFRLDAAGVDKLIALLRSGRTRMQPAHSRDYALGQKVEAVADPRWMTQPDLLNGDTLLHLLDPGFGWLHFLLPSAEARHLGELLLRQVEAKAETAPPKAN